jgi:hypothetical protein
MADFYPFYLGEHEHAWTKIWHIFGTLVCIALIVLAFVFRNYWLIPIGFVAAYGCAWGSHFLIEHNRPATFKHPFLSLMSDLRMGWDVVTGNRSLEDDGESPAQDDAARESASQDGEPS